MRLETTPRFQLEDVRALAARYSYRDDMAAIEAGRRAQVAGFYTREEFLTVCGWKSARTRKLWSDPSNSERVVREVTRIALSTEIEQLKIIAPFALRGVSWATASVLLHFAAGEPYPILDYRALWSVGHHKPAMYSFELWWAYTERCRRLAAEAGVTMRELDRALWQFSKQESRARPR